MPAYLSTEFQAPSTVPGTSSLVNNKYLEGMNQGPPDSYKSQARGRVARID